jgi:hypothetical protein
VQLAALEFCIELLNQTIQQRETEMALVCALAVLGVRPIGKGFRDEQTTCYSGKCSKKSSAHSIVAGTLLSIFSYLIRGKVGGARGGREANVANF